MNKKILYITYDGLTDNLGQSQIIPYLIGLSGKDFAFTILSCEKPNSFSKKKNQIEQLLKPHDITWVPLKYHKLPPVFSAIFDVWQLRKKAISLHLVQDFDIIHCRSYLPALIGLIIKQRYKTKFVFDMRGFWADERVDGNLWKLNNPILKWVYDFFKRKETAFINASDVTISLTKSGYIEMTSWRSVQNSIDKITVIPCCVDTTLFDPKSISKKTVEDLRQKLSFEKSTFVLCYLGSIGTWYLLDEMIDFFSCLLRTKPNAKFLFISPEKEHKQIKNVALNKRIALAQIVTVESSRSEVPHYLMLSQASIFFIKPSYSKKSSSPTKQAELMAMGIPVVSNKNVGDVEEIIKNSASGVMVNEFNTKNYIDVINTLDSVNFDSHKIRQQALEFFSLDKGVQLYKSVYDSI